MSDYPVYVFLIPIVAVVFIVVSMLLRRKRVDSYDTQYSQYRAAELAQRLGLSLEKGDPNFNLFITQANQDVDRGPSDKRPVHVDVHLAGEREGTPLELVYMKRIEQETELATVTRKYWFDCRMVAHARQSFPPFEVLSKKAPLGPIVQKQGIAAHPTGDASVDAVYAVYTTEPEMAKLLATLMPGFATFANSGVHLIGDGNTVAFVMQEQKAPLLANALYYAEVMAEQLVKVAKAIGG